MKSKNKKHNRVEEDLLLLSFTPFILPSLSFFSP